MKLIKKVINEIKNIIKKLAAQKKGELSYEDFEKLESKKYPFNPPRCDQAFKPHHPFRCTSDCIRKRS